MKNTLPILATQRNIGINTGSFGMKIVPTLKKMNRTYLQFDMQNIKHT